MAQQCESEELPQYAALSWIAAARCEGTLGNNVAETSYLLKAARQFLKAEEENSQTDCPSVSTEYLQVVTFVVCVDELTVDLFRLGWPVMGMLPPGTVKTA